MAKQLLDAGQVAALAGVQRRTVHQWLRRDHTQPRADGRRVPVPVRLTGRPFWDPDTDAFRACTQRWAIPRVSGRPLAHHPSRGDL